MPYIRPYDRDEDDELGAGVTEDWGYSTAPNVGDPMRLPGLDAEPDPGVAAASIIPTSQSGTAGFPEDDPYHFGEAPTVEATDANLFATDQVPGSIGPDIQPVELGGGGDDAAGDAGPYVYSEEPPGEPEGAEEPSVYSEEPSVPPAGEEAGDTFGYDEAPTVADTGLPSEPWQYDGGLADGQAAPLDEATKEAGGGPVGTPVAPDQFQPEPMAPPAGVPAPGPTAPMGGGAAGGTTKTTTTTTTGAGDTAVMSALQHAVLEAMKDPSRYDAGVVQEAAQVVQDQMAKMREEGYRGLGEHYAGRGLLGSSVEAEGMGRFEGELQRQGAEQLSALHREMAQTYGADRAAAMSAALGVSSQELQKQEMEQNQWYRKEGLRLQEKGMNQQDAQYYAGLAWQQEYGRGQLSLQQQQMQQDAGFRQRSLDLQEQGMSTQDAQFQASLEWQKEHGTQMLDIEREQMRNDKEYKQEVLRLEQAGMDQKDAQFYAEMGFKDRQMKADDEYRRDVLAFQEKGLSQEDAHFQAKQEYQKKKDSDEIELANMHLMLQALGQFPDLADLLPPPEEWLAGHF